MWLSLKYRTAGSLFARLLRHFDGIESIYRASESDYIATGEFTDNEIKFLSDKNTDGAARILHRCFSSDICVIPYDDPVYPGKLRAIESPPPVLYAIGELPDFNHSFSIAVVGSREMSPYGAEMCYAISSDLAVSGAVTVSGLALGIDAMCAGATLAVGGKHVAVLACGVDVVYPKTHAKLRESLLENGGAIISEYPPTTPVDKLHFAARNRLFAGITDATLVIEGESGSGTALTAGYALKTGKRIYTLPINITEKTSSLPLELLRSGAVPIGSAYDILTDREAETFSYLNPARIINKVPLTAKQIIEKYGIGTKVAYKMYTDTFSEREESGKRNWLKTVYGTVKKSFSKDEKPPKRIKNSEKDEKIGKNPGKTADPSDVEPLGDIAVKIYKAIDGEIYVDKLSELGIPFADISSTLTILEINGFIESLPGGRVKKKET